MGFLIIAAPVIHAQILTPPSVQYGPKNFVDYETAHVHPVDMTPDGKFLLVVDTPDGTLLNYDLSSGEPHLISSVAVGLDPVTVRARTATEAWVVNRVSGTISVVRFNVMQGLSVAGVVATFDVCHEPGDVVFAGSSGRAVVSCTRPNQLLTIDPTLYTSLATTFVAGESPRALALSSDKSTVYAAIFESGTPTTVLVGDTNDPRINNVTQNAAGPWGGLTPVPNNGKLFNPLLNPSNPTAPPVSAIVYKTGDGYFTTSVACTTAVFGSPIAGTARSCWQQDPVASTWTLCASEGATCQFTGRRRVIFGASGYTSSGRWQDDTNGDWTSIVTGNLSALSNRIAGWDLPDRDVAIFNVNSGQLTYQTRLMNAVMAISVNPVNQKVYAVGTDGTNSLRFQSILNGVFLRVNLAGFVPSQAPTITDLNPQLNYKSPSVSAAVNAQAIGDPRGIAWSADGSRGFITGMGSNNVLTIGPSGNRLALTGVGAGPTGVVVDDARNQVYVLDKFDSTLYILRLSDSSLLGIDSIFDPTPAVITAGRPFLYNTHIGSGPGHISCASCHIDGRTDRLSWDLGNPAGDMTVDGGATFHPMKGPMVTQTLQNMIGAPSLHHRGDEANLFGFAALFNQLQGTAAPLDTPSVTALQSFLANLSFAPNPNRNPDNSFGTAVALPGPLGTIRAYADANAGSAQFNTNACNLCHIGAMARDIAQGPNSLHLSQDMAPETMQGLFDRVGLFWQSQTGSTSGTGFRTNGAHDSTFANESTTNQELAYMFSFEGPQDLFAVPTASSHAGVGLQLQLTAAGSTQAAGTFCAKAGATCTFTGTREVIFGAAGQYVSGVFANSAPCNATAFGSDPNPGATETCALRAAPLTLCATNTQVCAFTGLNEVFYSSGSGPAKTAVLRNNATCTGTPFGVAPNSAWSCYIRPASEFARLNAMLQIAGQGKVGLVAAGLMYGLYRGGYYLGNSQFQSDMLSQTLSVSDLYAAVNAGWFIQLMLVPRGSEYRLGVDANLDGILNADQFLAKQNPRSPATGAWQSCAQQSATCSFSGPGIVRFGIPGSYAYGVFHNGVACSTSVFGDPAFGQIKSCDLTLN